MHWKITFCLTVISCLGVSASLRSQYRVRNDSLRQATLQLHREAPDQPFTLRSKANRQTSPPFQTSTSNFWSVQVNVDSTGRNILGDAANEPSIAIDPTNPSRMAIGWRQFDTIASNFRQAGVAYSINGGRTWKSNGVLEPGIFRSDPVLRSDAEGNFYYNSLTMQANEYSCVVFKSSNAGMSWDSAREARGGDKQWMAIDQTNGRGRGNIYAFWTAHYSSCEPYQSSRSTDHGRNFEECEDILGNPFWGTIAVGPVGEVYAAGRSSLIDTSIVVARSMTASDSSRRFLFNGYSEVNLDGNPVGFISASPNPRGLLGQTWIAVDHSAGTTRGYVYVLSTVKRKSLNDFSDVMISRSTDGGSTWSTAVRVNDDTSTAAWQWFGTMSVAPNGRIDAVWLDTRDNPGTFRSSLYYSSSTDAGVTWSKNQRLSPEFDPHLGWPQQEKMGDYFDMVSDDEGASVAWAGTFNGEQDVYFGRITYSPQVRVREEIDHHPTQLSLKHVFPHPLSHRSTITIHLPSPSRTRLTLFDALGRNVRTILDEERESGEHLITLDALNLQNGIYLLRLEAGKDVAVKTVVVVR